MKRNPAGFLFALLLVFFYSAIAVSQTLGIAKIYKPILVIPLIILLAGLVYFFYNRYGKQFNASLIKPSRNDKNTWLTAAFLISGLALLILLVFYPLVHWPYSPFTAQLPKDAAMYHFPKAVEMISTGSAWDLSIPYGEYPFGYESIIALAFSLNHAGMLLGTAHALIALFLFLAMLLLAARYTRLPLAPIVLLLSLLFLGYQMARNFESNIWWVFWTQIILIGKNDLFMGAALLAVLLFTPFSKEGPFFPFGLGLASAIALSIKPTSGLTLSFAWILMLFFIWRSHQLRKYLWELIFSAFAILPGGLWIYRNLAAQGALVSPARMGLSDWSISSNLTNPFFFKYIPQHLYIIMGILVVSAVVSIFRPALRASCLATLVLLATFAFTPASAFLGSTQVPAQIAWRFAIALLGYLFILLLALFEPLILPVYAWIARRAAVSLPLAICVLAFGSWGVWSQRDLMKTHPENAIALHEDFSEPVGVAGYYSAYDYVQKNVHNSVVKVLNGLPYYLYDEGLTNSVTASRPPDYIVYIKTTPQLDENTWQLVYQDPKGSVFKRK